MKIIGNINSLLGEDGLKKWVMRDYLTNTSLRARFGVEERNRAAVSRYIREAVEEEKIKPLDEEAPKK